MTVAAHVGGLGILGPGLAGWSAARPALSGELAYLPTPTVLPTPTILAAAERRRVGRVVKLALAIAFEATAQAGENPADLVSVFSSSGGDGQNCHELCMALATASREISPTRFANSVHNAASGYWSIGTHCMAESNVLCAYDASFTAGLLEAMTQVTIDRVPVLLVAYDSEYPQPLHDKRPIPDAFGIAMLLTPERRATSLAHLAANFVDEDFDRMAGSAFELLRSSTPAARALPLLRLLAGTRRGRTVLEYLDPTHVEVTVEPCG